MFMRLMNPFVHAPEHEPRGGAMFVRLNTRRPKAKGVRSIGPPRALESRPESRPRVARRTLKEMVGTMVWLGVLERPR